LSFPLFREAPTIGAFLAPDTHNAKRKASGWAMGREEKNKETKKKISRTANARQSGER
jgi:hypothetical protein